MNIPFIISNPRWRIEAQTERRCHERACSIFDATSKPHSLIGLPTFSSPDFPSKPATIHAKEEDEGLQRRGWLKKRREARFRPSVFGRASLLSVFGELEDAFKSHLFSSDAPQIPDFFSCLKGESGEENVGSPT